MASTSQMMVTPLHTRGVINKSQGRARVFCIDKFFWDFSEYQKCHLLMIKKCHILKWAKLHQQSRDNGQSRAGQDRRRAHTAGQPIVPQPIVSLCIVLNAAAAQPVSWSLSNHEQWAWLGLIWAYKYTNIQIYKHINIDHTCIDISKAELLGF